KKMGGCCNTFCGGGCFIYFSLLSPGGGKKQSLVYPHAATCAKDRLLEVVRRLLTADRLCAVLPAASGRLPSGFGIRRSDSAYEHKITRHRGCQSRGEHRRSTGDRSRALRQGRVVGLPGRQEGRLRGLRVGEAARSDP